MLKKQNLSCLLILVFCFFAATIKAQKKISADTIPQHSPKKAAILSAILPGAGQFYNKKYWKIGIIAAGAGALTYSLQFNNRNFHRYKNELIIRQQNTGTPDPDLSRFSNDNLNELQSYYRRNRDLTVVGFGLLYALNILDATVDAHLFDFDLDDSLSLRVQPHIQTLPGEMSSARGLSFQITF